LFFSKLTVPSPSPLLQFVTDLQAYPDDHMIGHFDGFQIYRCGIDVLSIRRVDQDGKAMELGRTGEFEF
jgi:hypothetical protein